MSNRHNLLQAVRNRAQRYNKKLIYASVYTLLVNFSTQNLAYVKKK